MMVREKLTGLAPPPAARSSSSSGGRWIEEKAGKDLVRLDTCHREPARLRPDESTISWPTWAWPRHCRGTTGEEDDDKRERRRTGPGESEGQDGEGQTRTSRCGWDSRRRKPGEEDKTRRARRRRPSAPSSDMPEESETGDAEEASQPWRPPDSRGNERQGPDYKAFSTKFDEVVDAEDLCDPEELDRLRAYLDKQLATCQGAVGAARQPAAAPPDGAAEPRLGLRPRRRRARPGAPAARRHRSDSAAVLQARARHRFPRHRGDAAARQFRLDARPADHRRGDLRRHPGAHARALRRQGRDPRLHHPRLEGRAVARSLARRPASRPIRAASTTCATSSTSPPTPRGGGRARISG